MLNIFTTYFENPAPWSNNKSSLLGLMLWSQGKSAFKKRCQIGGSEKTDVEIWSILIGGSEKTDVEIWSTLIRGSEKTNVEIWSKKTDVEIWSTLIGG